MGRFEAMVGTQETHESGFMTAEWPTLPLKKERREQEGKKGGCLTCKIFLAKTEV